MDRECGGKGEPQVFSTELISPSLSGNFRNFHADYRICVLWNCRNYDTLIYAVDTTNLRWAYSEISTIRMGKPQKCIRNEWEQLGQTFDKKYVSTLFADLSMIHDSCCGKFHNEKLYPIFHIKHSEREKKEQSKNFSFHRQLNPHTQNISRFCARRATATDWILIVTTTYPRHKSCDIIYFISSFCCLYLAAPSSMDKSLPFWGSVLMFVNKP